MVLTSKVKVIKRDCVNDRRITREKSTKQMLKDEYRRLMQRAAEIKREIQTA